MKTAEKNFKTKNLRNILLSATVGIIPCLFLCFKSTALYGLLYLYLAFPLLIIFFGSKPKVLKKRDIIDIAGRLYKKRHITYLLILIFAMFIVCCVTIGIGENTFKLYLPQGLIYSLPFFAYHMFCAAFSHPLSFLKGFCALKWQAGYVSYNSHFPSTQNLHRTVFPSHAVSSHSYNFSSSASSSSSFNNRDSFLHKHYLNPGSPSYWNK